MGGYCGAAKGGFGPVSHDWCGGYDLTPCFQSVFVSLLPPLWMLIAGTVYYARTLRHRQPLLDEWEWQSEGRVVPLVLSGTLALLPVAQLLRHVASDTPEPHLIVVNLLLALAWPWSMVVARAEHLRLIYAAHPAYAGRVLCVFWIAQFVSVCKSFESALLDAAGYGGFDVPAFITSVEVLFNGLLMINAVRALRATAAINASAATFDAMESSLNAGVANPPVDSAADVDEHAHQRGAVVGVTVDGVAGPGHSSGAGGASATLSVVTASAASSMVSRNSDEPGTRGGDNVWNRWLSAGSDGGDSAPIVKAGTSTGSSDSTGTDRFGNSKLGGGAKRAGGGADPFAGLSISVPTCSEVKRGGGASATVRSDDGTGTGGSGTAEKLVIRYAVCIRLKETTGTAAGAAATDDSKRAGGGLPPKHRRQPSTGHDTQAVDEDAADNTPADDTNSYTVWYRYREICAFHHLLTQIATAQRLSAPALPVGLNDERTAASVRCALLSAYLRTAARADPRFADELAVWVRLDTELMALRLRHAAHVQATQQAAAARAKFAANAANALMGTGSGGGGGGGNKKERARQAAREADRADRKGLLDSDDGTRGDDSAAHDGVGGKASHGKGTGTGQNSNNNKRSDRFSRDDSGDEPVPGFNWRVFGVTIKEWERRILLAPLPAGATTGNIMASSESANARTPQTPKPVGAAAFNSVPSAASSPPQHSAKATVLVFAVSVRTTRGTRWVTHKQFSDFVALRTTLAKRFSGGSKAMRVPDLPSTPPKPHSDADGQIDGVRVALETFLQQLVNTNAFACTELYAFLDRPQREYDAVRLQNMTAAGTSAEAPAGASFSNAKAKPIAGAAAAASSAAAAAEASAFAPASLVSGGRPKAPFQPPEASLSATGGGAFGSVVHSGSFEANVATRGALLSAATGAAAPAGDASTGAGGGAGPSGTGAGAGAAAGGETVFHYPSAEPAAPTLALKMAVQTNPSDLRALGALLDPNAVVSPTHAPGTLVPGPDPSPSPQLSAAHEADATAAAASAPVLLLASPPSQTRHASGSLSGAFANGFASPNVGGGGPVGGHADPAALLLSPPALGGGVQSPASVAGVSDTSSLVTVSTPGTGTAALMSPAAAGSGSGSAAHVPPAWTPRNKLMADAKAASASASASAAAAKQDDDGRDHSAAAGAAAEDVNAVHRFDVSIARWEEADKKAGGGKKGGGKHVVFHIVVREFFSLSDYLEWRIARRFSEFEAFADKLKARLKKQPPAGPAIAVPDLPSKGLLHGNSKTPEFLKRRAAGLEAFMQRVINTQSFQCDELFDFFALSDPKRAITNGTTLTRL